MKILQDQPLWKITYWTELQPADDDDKTVYVLANTLSEAMEVFERIKPEKDNRLGYTMAIHINSAKLIADICYYDTANHIE